MKIHRPLVPALLLGFAGLIATPRPVLAAADWSWKEKLASGTTLEIRNVNGNIEVGAASGPEVEVVVQKKARKSNPADVKIEVVKHAQGVTICAVYPAPAGAPPNECKAGGGRMKNQNNDVSVAFAVKLPAGLRFNGRTVNGNIAASSIGGDADLASVNGSIEVNSTGQVRAKTVNGNLHARMGRTDWTGELELATVNGSVTVELPASASTEVKGSTVNGAIDSDFGLAVEGRGPKKVSGTIGAGGRVLQVKSVNGSIQLRRRA